MICTNVTLQYSTFDNITELPSVLCMTLLVGRQEEHPACKNWVMRCWLGCLCKWFAYGPAAWCHCHPIISSSLRCVLVWTFLDLIASYISLLFVKF